MRKDGRQNDEMREIKFTRDYTKYANKAHMFNKNPDSDVEFLIEGNVNYLFCEKINIRWKCITSEENIKRHGTAKIINHK